MFSGLALLCLGGLATAADPVRQALQAKLSEASAFFARRPHLYRGTGYRMSGSELVRFLFGDPRLELRSERLDHLLGSSSLNPDNKYFLPRIPLVPLRKFLPVDRAQKARLRAAILEEMRGCTLAQYAEQQYHATNAREGGPFAPSIAMAIDDRLFALSCAKNHLRRAWGRDVAALQQNDRFPMVFDCDAGPHGLWLPGAPLEKAREYFAFSHIPVGAVRGVLLDLDGGKTQAHLRIDRRQPSMGAYGLSVHRLDPASGESHLVANFVKGQPRDNQIQAELMLQALPALRSLLPALLQQTAE